jgi:hypothetical protein
MTSKQNQRGEKNKRFTRWIIDDRCQYVVVFWCPQNAWQCIKPRFAF